MDQFFNWLAKPMNYEEIDAWYKANNIIPELSDLFRDFCFSLLNLVQDTYLGDTSNDNKETNIGLDGSADAGTEQGNISYGVMREEEADAE